MKIKFRLRHGMAIEELDISPLAKLVADTKMQFRGARKK